jgi:ornithine cyclodeaminase/alanine dehydrogenase-like protein (mu-crystallin family)
MALWLDEKDVSSLLPMTDLVPLMERTLADFSSGRAVQPVRSIVPVRENSVFMGVMPAWLPSSGSLAVKMVTLAPRNAERGLPTHLATILLMDPTTGHLLSIMDGRLITEKRTAAVSAAASKALARAESATLAILGSGVQARSHLEAFRLVHRLASVRVWSPTKTRREAMAAEAAEEWKLEVRPAGSAEEAVLGADLVITVTAATEPVLRGAWLAKGTHLTGVGADAAAWREVDGEAVRRSRVFVDSMEAARVEAGDLIQAEKEGSIPPGHAAGEIGSVFAGTLAGREGPEQITFFKSLGLAVEDAACARLAYDRARERGVGREIGA